MVLEVMAMPRSDPDHIFGKSVQSAVIANFYQDHSTA